MITLKVTDDAGLARFERQRAKSHFGFRQNSDEMTRLWGLLDPEWSAILTKEVRAEARRIAKARGCSVDDHIQADQGAGG